MTIIDINMDIEIKNAIRHDFHKLMGAKHTNDKKLSTKADMHVSAMSRPPKLKKPIYTDGMNNYRLLLIDNNTLYEPGQQNRDMLCSKIRYDYDLDCSAETLYNRLLRCNSLSRFNEAIDLPYTSLKYHTILTTNIHWNYLQNKKFEQLRLKVVSTDLVNCIFDVIYIDDNKNKCLVLSDKDSYTNFEAIANIGSTPYTNFGNVISRMAGDIYFDKFVFSNLRRIKSWSVGLQYLEDCRGSL